MTTYSFLAPLTNLDLVEVITNTYMSDRTRLMAKLLLNSRIAYQAGDYFSCAELIVLMGKVGA